MLLTIFKLILTTPFPLGGIRIIILSALGTDLSIYFADELMNIFKHSEIHEYHAHKKKLIIINISSLAELVIINYYVILNKLGLHLL